MTKVELALGFACWINFLLLAYLAIFARHTHRLVMIVIGSEAMMSWDNKKGLHQRPGGTA